MITFLIGMAVGTIVQGFYTSYDMIKRADHHIEQLQEIKRVKEEIRNIRGE